ncbi:MAG: glycosyltransferase, partial [Bacteroidota bacterium]
GAVDLIYLAVVKLFFGAGLGSRTPALFFGAVCFLSGLILFVTGLLAEQIGRNSSFRDQYKIKETVGGQKEKAVN